MTEPVIKKTSFDGKEVAILGPTYEPGKPKEKGDWRHKLPSRQDILKYLQHGERYWYSKEWFGSEKRKNPA